MKGLIFDIKRYSIHDGPGIRTTIFLKGCPLRCAWCHNPEGQSDDIQIVHYTNKCIGCLTCKAVCHTNAIIFTLSGVRISDDCDYCLKCTKECPTLSLEAIGKYYDLDELIDEILKDEIFFDNGGITISGGEPFVQPLFLLELSKKLKKHGIHIAIDTTGYTDFRNIEKVLPYVDLFLYDLKIMDSRLHKLYTGVDNGLILENLLKLSKKAPISIRIPIIPTINDSIENLEATASFIKKNTNIVLIDLLPYHNIMIDKYKRLNVTFLLGNIQPPSDEKMLQIAKFFQDYKFLVNIGG